MTGVKNGLHHGARKGIISPCLTLIDLLFACYMSILSLLILFFHEGVRGWGVYLLIHGVLILSILYVVPFFEKSGRRLLVFIRWWYPVLLFTFNYKEINAFTHIIVSEWRDASILAFEKSLLGFHPSLLLDGLARPLITELMKFDYFTYYLMVPVGAAFLYVSGNRKAYIRYLSTVCLAFYISYIGFILYPVRGPRFHLYDRYRKDYRVNIKEFYGNMVEEDVAGKDTMALRGYAFTGMQDFIMRYGSLHGGCMPSSHIAVAFVCMMVLWIYRRKLFFYYLPLVTILCVAVVYNRYHYVTDVIAGLVVGVVSLWAVPGLMKLWEKIQAKTVAGTY
ncbi:MAG: phosphatase PAP2 family protein [Elusimicrobia bacterium]|nr:phosphatase PAP2 family protein [Elusimicrobiota bacterium]